MLRHAKHMEGNKVTNYVIQCFAVQDTLNHELKETIILSQINTNSENYSRMLRNMTLFSYYIFTPLHKPRNYLFPVNYYNYSFGGNKWVQEPSEFSSRERIPSIPKARHSTSPLRNTAKSWRIYFQVSLTAPPPNIGLELRVDFYSIGVLLQENAGEMNVTTSSYKNLSHYLDWLPLYIYIYIYIKRSDPEAKYIVLFYICINFFQ